MELSTAMGNPLIRELLSDPKKLAAATDRLQALMSGTAVGSSGPLPTNLKPPTPVAVNFKFTPESAIRAIGSNILGLGDNVVLIWGGTSNNVVISIVDRLSVHGARDGDKIYDPKQFFNRQFELVLRQSPSDEWWKRAIIEPNTAMSQLSIILNDRQGIQELLTQDQAQAK